MDEVSNGVENAVAQNVTVPNTLLPKVMVWFEWKKGDQVGRGRVTFAGLFDLRTEYDVAEAERAIVEQSGNEAVQITNWKTLEG